MIIIQIRQLYGDEPLRLLVPSFSTIKFY